MTTEFPDNTSTIDTLSNLTYNEKDLEPYCVLKDVLTGCITVVGLCGNAMAIVVFLTSKLRNVSYTLYLIVIGFTDSFYLITHVIFTVILPYSDIDVESQDCFGNKLRSYVETMMGSLSLWLIMEFSIQRFVGIWYPHRYKKLCFPLRRKKIVIATVLLNVTLYIFILFIPNGRLLSVSFFIVLMD